MTGTRNELDIATPLDDASAYTLARSMRANPELRSFRLIEQAQLSQDALRELADAALSSPALERLQLRDVGLERATIGHICGQAAQHEALTSICLSKHDLSANVDDLCNMLHAKRNWQRVRLMDCRLDEPAATRIAQSLGAQPDLCRFHMQHNIPDKQDYPAINEALKATGSVNLLSVLPSGAAMAGFLSANKAACEQSLDDAMASWREERSLTMRQNARMAKRLPAMPFIARNADERHVCEDYLAAIPAWDGTAQGLLGKTNYLGQCPAEKPATWQNPDAVLDAADAPLVEWLRQEIPSGGGNLLACGLAFNPQGMVQALNGRGVQLRHAQLLTPQGKPDTILSALLEEGTHAALFGAENWEGAKPAELRAVLGALSPAQREAIPNRYQLLAELGNAQQSGLGR